MAVAVAVAVAKVEVELGVDLVVGRAAVVRVVARAAVAVARAVARAGAVAVAVKAVVKAGADLVVARAAVAREEARAAVARAEPIKNGFRRACSRFTTSSSSWPGSPRVQPSETRIPQRHLFETHFAIKSWLGLQSRVGLAWLGRSRLGLASFMQARPPRKKSVT